MKIKVPYGKTYQFAELPDDLNVQVIDPQCEPVNTKAEDLIEEALDHPIASEPLEKLLTPEDHPLIVVNDQTRPGPNKEMVAAILRRIAKVGIPDEHVQIIIATGTHRAPTDEELSSLVGEDVKKRIYIYSHDCRKNNVYLGTTEDGLPVYVDKMAVDSSFIITTGLVAPHKAAGFSGGRKSIVPGVAGIETLRIHHSLPIRPYEPALGWFEENPFHLAALQAAKLVKVRFILNAVQDTHKQNVAMVAGDLEKAHAEGVRICREHNTVECKNLGDVVITSPGGAPRDCNLYQGQKALATGEVFARKDGHATLILVAEAEDGIGPEGFQEWMIEGENPQAIIDRFRREGFSEGTNKAFEYARALTKGRLIIVSENVDPDRIRQMKMDWAPDLQTAVNMVLKEKRPEQVIVLPKAVSLIPHLA